MRQGRALARRQGVGNSGVCAITSEWLTNSALASYSFPALSPLSVAMAYSTNSGPFWVGSLIFLIIGVVACFASSALAKAGRNQYLG